MTRIFVGNLPYNPTGPDLTTLFSQHGEVTSATVIVDRATGRSKGFGFVEMPDDAQANKAISELNGKPFNDRNLAVSVARPREERPQ